MKIVLVSKQKVLHAAGESIFMSNLEKCLSEKGLEFDICETAMAPSPRSFFESMSTYSRIPDMFASYRKLRKIKDYDILHFLNSAECLAGLPKKGVKIATSHILGRSHYRFYQPRSAFEGAVESAYSLYSSLLDRAGMNSMDAVVTSSSYHADDIHESCGVPRSKLKVIAPGVDVSYIKSLPKTDLKSKYDCDSIIVYIGRILGFRKGLQYLINAMGKDAPYKLLVIGGGPDQPYFERLVKEKGLESKVIFLGFLNFREKTIIQKSADAVIIPSVSESFCMVFAESLACEVPVVAFDLPFWKPLYQGAGLFVQKDSLADGISAILDDARLRKQVTSKGKDLVKDYDVKKTASDYIKLYESFF